MFLPVKIACYQKPDGKVGRLEGEIEEGDDEVAGEVAGEGAGEEQQLQQDVVAARVGQRQQGAAAWATVTRRHLAAEAFAAASS